MTRQDRERFFVDCLFVMKTRKQDLQQILANLTDSALGGEIVGACSTWQAVCLCCWPV